MRRSLVSGKLGAVALTALALYLGCPFRLSVVRGESMAPSIHNGEILLLDRRYYDTHPVRAGEVIIFRHRGELLTKRIFAAPGSTIALEYYPDLGSYEIPEPREIARLRKEESEYPRLVDLAIPPGKCFVLGDNIDDSYDSRAFGPIETRTILGRVVTQ